MVMHLFSQVLTLELPEGAQIWVYDGEDSSFPLLDTMNNEHNPHSVISTGNVLSVYYVSGDRHALDYQGFIIRYQSGTKTWNQYRFCLS